VLAVYADVTFKQGKVKIDPRRGVWLTIFLVLSFIGNAIAAIIAFVTGFNLLPSISELGIAVITTTAVLFALAATNIAFVVGIWQWKKWGVYGFSAVTIIVFIFNVIGSGFTSAALGLVGLGVLLFLVRNVWTEME
jgi:hypothetical protein